MSEHIQIDVTSVYGRHVSEHIAHIDVRISHELGEEIRDSTAVTIASWWQSTGRVGSVLAGFASGAKVDRDELLADISASRAEAITTRDRLALDMLSTFVMNYKEN